MFGRVLWKIWISGTHGCAEAAAGAPRVLGLRQDQHPFHCPYRTFPRTRTATGLHRLRMPQYQLTRSLLPFMSCLTRFRPLPNRYRWRWL